MNTFARLSLALLGATAILGYVIAFTTLGLATWKPEYQSSAAQMQWFKNAKTTDAAYLRLRWRSCCDNADRVVATFEQDGASENWYYLKDGKRILIPADTIHTERDEDMPSQLQAEGVLFVVNGVVACFWPPETGG